MIRTACVRDGVSPDDGRRVLVMRYWPRGMTREQVAAEHVTALAPSVELLSGFKARRVAWPVYEERFRDEMRRPAAQAALAALRAADAAGEVITLLCECRVGPEGEDEIRCHRRVLLELLQEDR